VILYPRPTVFSAHPLIRIHRQGRRGDRRLDQRSRARTRLGGSWISRARRHHRQGTDAAPAITLDRPHPCGPARCPRDEGAARSADRPRPLMFEQDLFGTSERSYRRACALRAEPEPAVHRTQNVGVVVGPIALAVGRFGFDPFVRGRKIADVGFLTRTDHDVG